MKKSNLLAVLVAIGFLMTTKNSQASQGRGGADEIYCNKEGVFSFLSSGNRELTDRKSADRYGESSTFTANLFGQSEAFFLSSFIHFIEEKAPIEAQEVKSALQNISFKLVNEVEKLDTGVYVSKTSSILFGCSRVQIAVQDFDTPSQGLSQVRYISEVDSMSNADRALFKIHESFIYLAHQKTNDLKQMETIARNKIAEILNSKDLTGSLIVSYIKDSSGSLPQSERNQVYLDRFDEIDLQERKTLYQSGTAVSALSQMLNAGLDKDLNLGCKVSLLDGFLDEQAGYPSSYAIAVIEAGAKLDAPDMEGLLPIHLAVARQDSDVTEALIQHGADINAPWCKPGSKAASIPKTPLDIAHISGWQPGKGSPENQILLKSLGAKSGSEINFRCPKTLEPTSVELLNEGCKK